MILKEVIHIDHLNHAYLIEGERSTLLPEVLSFLEVSGISTKNSPDLHILEHDAFLIEDAHALRREQQMRAGGGAKKIFIIAFNTMTSEAQNALLKTLEEPTEDTHFFLITRTRESLFATVRSRLQIIRGESKRRENKMGTQFLDSAIPERLLFIETYTKVKADDKSEAKDSARDFLTHLELALAARVGSDARYANAITDVISAKRYLSDRGPSLKILLEQIALTLPLV